MSTEDSGTNPYGYSEMRAVLMKMKMLQLNDAINRLYIDENLEIFHDIESIEDKMLDLIQQ